MLQNTIIYYIKVLHNVTLTNWWRWWYFNIDNEDDDILEFDKVNW